MDYRFKSVEFYQYVDGFAFGVFFFFAQDLLNRWSCCLTWFDECS